MLVMLTCMFLRHTFVTGLLEKNIKNKNSIVMKWIILAAAALFAVSCSNDSKWNENNLAKGDVNVDIKAEAMGGAYKRGDAPAYIASIDLNADNLEYNVADISGHFALAADNTGDDIKLTGLTVGSNEFTATGNPANAELNEVANIAGFTTTNTELDDIAADYSAKIAENHPIYALYTGDKTQDVVKGTGNNVEIAMASENHRVAIVLENASVNNTLKMEILNGATLIHTFDAVAAGADVAYIINDAAAKNDITYTVKVTYNNGTDDVVITKTIDAVALKNITKLYRFASDKLDTGDATFTFTWAPFVVDNGGEEL